MEILESPIETALQKANLTTQAIEKLKEFLPLTVNGVEDKEGYKKANDARILCKNTRVLAEKICKKGREEAIAIQKSWIAKEKEVTGQISEVENHLANEIKKVDDAIEEQKKIEAAKKQLPIRQQKLSTINVTVTDDELLSMDDARFFVFFSEQYDLFIAKQQAELKAQQDAIDLENKRIADEKAAALAEEKRLADLEQARKDAEIKAKADAAAAIEKAQADAAKAEQDRVNAIAKAEQDKADALAKAEREKNEAIEAEKKKAKDEADRIERERLAAIEKEKQDKIELDRKAALAPDKDKLTALAESLALLQMPDVYSVEAKKIVAETKTLINKTISFIKEKSESL